MNKMFLATALIATAVFSNVFASAEGGDATGFRLSSPRSVLYVEQGVYATDLASLRESLGLNQSAIDGVRTDLENLCSRVKALEDAGKPAASVESKSQEGQGPVVAPVDSHARYIAALKETVKAQGKLIDGLSTTSNSYAFEAAKAQRTANQALFLAVVTATILAAPYVVHGLGRVAEAVRAKRHNVLKF